MSLRKFLGQLLVASGIGTAQASQPTSTPTTASPVPTTATPTFPIPNWRGIIPKGAALYRYKYEQKNGGRGTIEVLARNAVNAESKARKRLYEHYQAEPFSLELVGQAKG
jgi:hypothetical protein